MEPGQGGRKRARREHQRRTRVGRRGRALSGTRRDVHAGAVGGRIPRDRGACRRDERFGAGVGGGRGRGTHTRSDGGDVLAHRSRLLCVRHVAAAVIRPGGRARAQPPGAADTTRRAPGCAADR